MSRSYIVQLSDRPVEEGCGLDFFELVNNKNVTDYADWIDDDPVGRDEAVRAVRENLSLLKDVIESFDPEEMKITFRNTGKVRTSLVAWMQEEISKEMGEETPSPGTLIYRLQDYKGCNLLLSVELNGEDQDVCTSSRFVHDVATGSFPKEMYVGDIFGYHY